MSSTSAAFRPLTPPVGASTVVAPLPLTAKSARLESLDIFRGATIAMMLLVNNAGSGSHAYAPLDHADWNGWTPTDLVFPFFLFIMGVAIPFSLGRRLATEGRSSLFLQILARGLSLFLLGELGYAVPNPRPGHSSSVVFNIVRIIACVFLGISFIVLLYPWKTRRRALMFPPIVGLSFLAMLFILHFVNQHALAAGWVTKEAQFGGGMLNPDKFRIPGVLQRIGVCYAVAASIMLIASWHVLILAIIALLTGYSLLMLKVRYPSVLHHGTMVHGLLGKDDNLARYVDTTVFRRHVYGEYPDPEGLVSTIPSIATALMGILAGIWLRTVRPAVDRCAGLLTFGLIVTCLGAILNSTLMPINKNLWTPSFSVFCAGMAMLGLGGVFYFADVLQYRRWGLPFKIYGMNAITAFVLSGIVGRLLIITHWPNGDVSVRKILVDQVNRLEPYVTYGNTANNLSLAYAVGYVLFFLIFMAIFYRLKIFLKV